jgi:hypothetical protein
MQIQFFLHFVCKSIFSPKIQVNNLVVVVHTNHEALVNEQAGNKNSETRVDICLSIF